MLHRDGWLTTMKNLRTSLLLTALVIALVSPLPASLADPPGDERCANWEHEEGVGDVCRRGNGLYEVFAPGRGRSLGYTHGVDPVPGEGDLETPGAPRPPACVAGSPGEYYTRVFYARAADDADQFGALVGTIRSLVEQANGLVYEAGVATGGTADIKIKCNGTTIEVTNVVLPTPKAQASFSTIVNDMNNLGFTDGKVKHWVYYDDSGACTCGGTGHVYDDDRAGVENWNNGNGVALFAVDFGWNSVRIMLHELGHNLGAVQDSAPHSTLAGHCIDGHDIMCYNDGGPNGNQYSTGFCAVEIWDCGRDDYFHRSPTGGSYLATHWNIGNTVNRFLQFGGAPGEQTPPSIAVSEPRNGWVYNGCTAANSNVASLRPVFVDRGCAKITVSDPETVVTQVRVLFGGVLKQTFVNPVEGQLLTSTFDVSGPSQLVELRIEATNSVGLTGVVTVLVGTSV